jgi:hypothetical protein
VPGPDLGGAGPGRRAGGVAHDPGRSRRAPGRAGPGHRTPARAAGLLSARAVEPGGLPRRRRAGRRRRQHGAVVDVGAPGRRGDGGGGPAFPRASTASGQARCRRRPRPRPGAGGRVGRGAVGRRGRRPRRRAAGLGIGPGRRRRPGPRLRQHDGWGAGGRQCRPLPASDASGQHGLDAGRLPAGQGPGSVRAGPARPAAPLDHPAGAGAGRVARPGRPSRAQGHHRRGGKSQ